METNDIIKLLRLIAKSLLKILKNLAKKVFLTN